MAGTNDFRTFAEGGSANVLSQTDYDALSATVQANGFSSGLAKSERANKVWRQCCAIAHLIGSFISSKNLDAKDDGDPSTLLANFTAAVTPPMSTEDSAGIMKLAADADVAMGTSVSDKAVTPLRLLGGAEVLLASEGFLKLPKWLGGLIINWGDYTTSTSGDVYVPFNKPYTSACFGVYTGTAISTTGVYTGFHQVTLSGFNVSGWVSSSVRSQSYGMFLSIGI